MAHRGPDGEGLWASPSGNCVLGHRRLAILDLSPSSAQPMSRPNGRHVLAYNGECYNFRDLADELRRLGVPVTTTGDCEVVLHHLARDEAHALPRLNGMFALALWNEGEQRVLLARDRWGQKPLYWARSGELLLFASEVRSLLASGLVPARLNTEAVLGYLSFGAVQGPDTVFAGVYLLPPACSMSASTSPVSYWRPPREKVQTGDRELRKAFIEGVRRHLVSDAPIGVFLSGGIDSSAIAFAAAAAGAGEVRSLCVAFPEAQEDPDPPHAREVARRAGTRHEEVAISGADAKRLVSRAIASMDQPTFDGINTYIVSHAAKEAGLKVALSGLGGDELFGGYPSFGDVPRLLRIRRWLSALRRPLAAALSWGNDGSRSRLKLADFLESPGSLVDAYLVRRRLFTAAEIRQLGVLDGWSPGLSAPRLAELSRLAEDRAVADAVGLLEMDCYMGQLLLRDSDVMGMAHGLEIRAPFLDTEFTERALMLDAGTRQPTDPPKSAFSHAMAGLVPEAVASRTKRGFRLPLETWMMAELKEEIRSSLAALPERVPSMRREAVEHLWARFQSSSTGVGWQRIWALHVLSTTLGRHLRPQP